MKRILSILLLIIIICAGISNVYAVANQSYSSSQTTAKMPTSKPSTGSTTDAGTIITDAQGFLQSGEKKLDEIGIDEDKLENLSDSIYGILLIAGIIIAVIVGLILGIKFIMGSVEQKAEIKNALIVYVGGCVVVFGAFIIWKLVVDVLQSV